MQLVRDILDCLPLEGSRVTLVTVQTGDLTQDSLDHMPDGHTRRDSVRVDNHVGNDAFNSEWQVFLSIGHTASSLLTVTTGKLVTDLGHLDCSHLDLDQAAPLLV